MKVSVISIGLPAIRAKVDHGVTRAYPVYVARQIDPAEQIIALISYIRACCDADSILRTTGYSAAINLCAASKAGIDRFGPGCSIKYEAPIVRVVVFDRHPIIMRRIVTVGQAGKDSIVVKTARGYPTTVYMPRLVAKSAGIFHAAYFDKSMVWIRIT